VTTFNRGLSGTDVDGVQVMRGDRTRPGDLDDLVVAGVSWDAVIDTSGFVPRDVLAACQRLKPAAARYVFMSTVSVYRGWPVEPLSESSEVLYCPPDAGPDYGADVEDGPTKYGYQKSGCELAVATTFGPDRATILRPGVVLGPREYAGRLPWWLSRIARGGKVLAPGSPGRTIQPIDVRDLAAFVALAVQAGTAGAFNLAAPRDSETFGELLDACVEVTGPTRSSCGFRMSGCSRAESVSGQRCRCGGPSAEYGKSILRKQPLTASSVVRWPITWRRRGPGYARRAWRSMTSEP
jgi:nucleoside-diphosphate-sugar epimerase